MSTNPNNAVGTNGAYGGRTSVNALNDNLAAYSRGILSGWACSPNSGLTVSLGGDGTTRDVAIAEDNAGNKTTINNISGSPIDVTLSAAPGSNSRIDLIVAYVDNPPQGTDTETDNPGACGIIAVSGNAAISPTAPDDSAIRTAITADGASGTTAYYVVLANITVASGTTDIDATMIQAGSNAGLGASNLVSSSTTDSRNWRKMPLSSSVNIYLVKGSSSVSLNGNQWKDSTVVNPPIGIDTTNIYGIASAKADDNAVSTAGYLNINNGNVLVQMYNAYNQAVNTTIRWEAMIVEFL